MAKLNSTEKKQIWFDSFLYVFNLHWDKVDNFRIDKYLMFLRFQFAQMLKFLKASNYNTEIVSWYKTAIFKLFND